jgi:signal peptidase I
MRDGGKRPDGGASEEREKTEARRGGGILAAAYDLCEVLGVLTAVLMTLFAFCFRLNIVDGSSMRKTLSDGDLLVVSSVPVQPERGDIVIVHRIDAGPYDRPIVKRVIAVGGQTVDIDFDTWTLTVDGKVTDEPYRWIDRTAVPRRSEIPLPVTLGENEIFVMGDNRNGSADSRAAEIGPVDIRCVVGKALARLKPRFSVFQNPFGGAES